MPLMAASPMVPFNTDTQFIGKYKGNLALWSQTSVTVLQVMLKYIHSFIFFLFHFIRQFGKQDIWSPISISFSVLILKQSSFTLLKLSIPVSVAYIRRPAVTKVNAIEFLYEALKLKLCKKDHLLLRKVVHFFSMNKKLANTCYSQVEHCFSKNEV